MWRPLTNIENDQLCNAVEEIGYRVIRGSENRCSCNAFVTPLSQRQPISSSGLRATAQLIDPNLVDEAVQILFRIRMPITCQMLIPQHFPDGLDVEVFSMQALATATLSTAIGFDREHVTPFIRNGNFKRMNLKNAIDTSDLRLTLDEPDDLTLLSKCLNIFNQIFISIIKK